MPNEKSKLVYSTDRAILKTASHRGKESGEKALRLNLRPVQQKVTVRLDRKGRGGKSVTVIEGLPMAKKEAEALLKQLKAGLGTGGTARDTALEIQGDHRSGLMAALEKMGYRTKHSDG